MGVSTIHRVTSNLIATLSPQDHAGELTLQIALFDTTNPFEFTRISSCPIRKQLDAKVFNLQHLAYNEASDTLLVFTSDAHEGSGSACFELKLSKLVYCGHLSEIPNFVKEKQLPYDSG